MATHVPRVEVRQEMWGTGLEGGVLDGEDEGVRNGKEKLIFGNVGDGDYARSQKKCCF